MYYKIPASSAGISMPGQKSQNSLIKPVMNGRNCIIQIHQKDLHLNIFIAGEFYCTKWVNYFWYWE